MEDRYVVIAFMCVGCGRKLQAHMRARAGVGAGGYSCRCPECGQRKDGFPDEILRVRPAQAIAMTDSQKTVAEAALAAAPTADLPQLVDCISKQVKMQPLEVGTILRQLVKAGILREDATGTRNVAAGEPPKGFAKMWYVKGPDWVE